MKPLKLIIVVLFILPNLVFASWWNPFTWSRSFSNIFKTQTTTTTTPTKTKNSGLKQTNQVKNSSANLKPLFGTMIAFNINDATTGISEAIQKGWSEFIKDDSANKNLLDSLKKLIQDRTKLVKATGFSIDRASFVYFTWNVIEPQKGQFHWELTDIYVKGASNAGLKISAVIEPFAGWDQEKTRTNANCKMLDAAYYDYKAGPPNDITEYENFLAKTVERYKNNVAVWEIGNENDAECGGYENNPKGYFDLLKISSETIKKADPRAVVTNGGASGHYDNNDEISFWTKIFQLGGSQYIDYFNLHYNDERGPSPKLDPDIFQKNLMFWNDLMDKNGGRKPLYLTEFGIYSGSPSSEPTGQFVQGTNQVQINMPVQTPLYGQSSNPSSGDKCGDGICDAFEKQNSNACPQDCGTGSQLPIQKPQTEKSVSNQSLPKESPESQAILYFKDSIIAFGSGAKMVFIDLVGPNDSVVGSSMAFNTNGQARLFLSTLKNITNKIGGFSKAEKITSGQYKFIVNSKTIYALWTGTIPNEISGKAKVTDMEGREQFIDATKIKLSSDQPIFVEI